MRSKRSTALLVIVLAISQIGTGSASADSPVSVLAQVSGALGEESLSFRVVNQTEKPIEMASSSLPWNSQGALVIVAKVDRARGWALLPVAHDVRRAASTETLLPGGELIGERRLSESVEDWRSARQGADLVVFWHSRPKTAQGSGVGDHGGYIVLARPGSVATDFGPPLTTVTADAGKGAILALTLKNVSGRALVIPSSDLPWVYPPRTVIAAGFADPPQPLDTRYPLIGLPEGSVRIPPGETTGSAIALDERIRDASRALGQRDLVVFWYFDGRRAESGNLGDGGGYAVFKQ